MKELIKKLSIPAYLLLGSAVISLIAMIIMLVSVSDPSYGMVETVPVALLSVLAIVLCVGTVFCAGKLGDSYITTILVVAIVLVTSFCVYLTVNGKTIVFGTIIFSSLEKGYAPAERACWLGVTSIVMYVVSTLITAVGAFFKLSK